MKTKRSVSEQVLRQTVAEFVFCDPAKLSANDHFEDDLGLDSIDRIDLLTEVEKRHDVAFSDDEIVSIVDFGQLVTALSQKSSGE